MAKTISIDFGKIFSDIINYFKNLTTDMIIAYAVLGVGVIALIIAFSL